MVLEQASDRTLFDVAAPTSPIVHDQVDLSKRHFRVDQAASFILLMLSANIDGPEER